MIRMNCWEFKRCGREPGGAKVAEMGTCVAAVEVKVDGINGGRSAGRACWAVAGTLCGGKVQGTFAAKLSSCLACDFYNRVIVEEGAECWTAKEIINLLNS